ncbi:MAG: hypothetical protein LCH63_20940 [Candidatus Melainabacteria bacterium]|nr:hypothetical protein [Candidatus Melainabacteria bacterium]
MSHLNSFENSQSAEKADRAIRENTSLNYSDVMTGQNPQANYKVSEMSAKGSFVPELQIVDPGRSSDTQEAARLSRVIHSGNLLQELDGAKNGKLDGKISKHDLDIYLRMHPENSPQRQAVQEMRDAWDNRYHPSHGAVQLLRKELSNERKEHKIPTLGNPGYEEMPSHRRPQMARPDSVDCEPAERPARKVEAAPRVGENNKTRSEVPSDLREAGQVRPGEGYYQVAKRMLECTGQKPNHNETMEFVKALQTANDNKNVLTVRDNLSNLLDKNLPGNQGKVRDYLRRSH